MKCFLLLLSFLPLVALSAPCQMGASARAAIRERNGPFFAQMRDVSRVEVDTCVHAGTGCCLIVRIGQPETQRSLDYLYPGGLFLDSLPVEFVE